MINASLHSTLSYVYSTARETLPVGNVSKLSFSSTRDVGGESETTNSFLTYSDGKAVVYSTLSYEGTEVSSRAFHTVSGAAGSRDSFSEGSRSHTHSEYNASSFFSSTKWGSGTSSDDANNAGSGSSTGESWYTTHFRDNITGKWGGSSTRYTQIFNSSRARTASNNYDDHRVEINSSLSRTSQFYSTLGYSWTTTTFGSSGVKTTSRASGSSSSSSTVFSTTGSFRRNKITAISHYSLQSTHSFYRSSITDITTFSGVASNGLDTLSYTYQSTFVSFLDSLFRTVTRDVSTASSHSIGTDDYLTYSTVSSATILGPAGFAFRSSNPGYHASTNYPMSDLVFTIDQHSVDRSKEERFTGSSERGNLVYDYKSLTTITVTRADFEETQDTYTSTINYNVETTRSVDLRRGYKTYNSYISNFRTTRSYSDLYFNGNTYLSYPYIEAINTSTNLKSYYGNPAGEYYSATDAVPDPPRLGVLNPYAGVEWMLTLSTDAGSNIVSHAHYRPNATILGGQTDPGGYGALIVTGLARFTYGTEGTDGTSVVSNSLSYGEASLLVLPEERIAAIKVDGVGKWDPTDGSYFVRHYQRGAL